MTAATQWVPVGDLGAAFEEDANILPPVNDLAGRRLTLHFEDGHSEQLDFTSGDRMTRSAGDAVADTAYMATRLRDGIYFIDLPPEEGRAECLSMVLDLNLDIFTAIDGRLPSRPEAERSALSRVAAGEELTGVAAEFRHGAINTPVTPGTLRHEQTEELVNKRVEYVYSSTERYEHIYLNPRFYTWHCLEGVEKGLADTDRCHYYRLADQLYLFVWREKIVPTLGIVLLDLEAMKTTGKIMGYEGYDFGKLTNFPVGAVARVLNVTPRP